MPSEDQAEVLADVERRVLAWMAEHGLSEKPYISIGFECEKCGEYCTFDAGMIYEEGECFACSHRTKVTLESYILIMAAPGGDDGPSIEVWAREEEREDG